jgi:hypothetical protein
MWQQKLENEGFVTLYYDAWSNDFVDDPLVAFIDEITTRIEGRDELEAEKWQERIEKMKSFANTVAWRTIPVGLKLLTAGLLDAKDFNEQVLSEAVQNVSGEAIEQYRSMKDDVAAFREALTELVEEVQTAGDGNPIVLFVDELDRCRPDHAVLLLERIKHFFSIPGITFVLSMEPDQLQHSVRALYGSGFDAKGYLRRFIDLDFPLPEPDFESYGALLYKHHGIDEITGVNGNDGSLKQAHIQFARTFNWGLREQKKFGLRAQFVYRIASQECGMDIATYVFLGFLIALRMDRPSVLINLRRQTSEGHEAAMKVVRQIRSNAQSNNAYNAVAVGNILEACLRYWGIPLSSAASAYELINDLQDSESLRIAKLVEHIDRNSNRSVFEILLDIVDITRGLNHSPY